MQAIRFRKLTSHFDGEAYAEVERALSTTSALDVLPIETSTGVPRQVTARDGSGTVEQVRILLRSGDLQLTDLVDVGDGWETIEDCVLFESEREQLLRRSTHQRWVLGACVALGSLVLLWALLR
jgi:hypothetical protein